MSQLSNLHQTYLDYLRMKVHNPGGKFITPTDEDAALNEASLTVASRLGGLLQYLDRSVALVANQNDYTLPDQYRQVLYLEIADTTVTPTKFLHVDVVRYQDFRVLGKPTTSGAYLAYFEPERNNLHIEPAPTAAQAGLFFWIVVRGLPQRIFIAAAPPNTAALVALYDGDLAQIAAVTKEAASILRLKSRDVPESDALHARAMENVEDAAVVEHVKNMATHASVGRHTPLSKLRRF